MARKLSDGLRKKQDNQKQNTIKIIKDAIYRLKEIGYEDITIKNLVAETKLARSTFSKPHVEEILKENQIGKYRNIKTLVIEKQALLNNSRLEEVEKLFSNSQIKLKKIEKELLETRNKLKEEKLKRMELEIENKEMVMNFQKMYERAIAMGIEIIL